MLSIRLSEFGSLELELIHWVHLPQLDLHHLDFTKNPDRATYYCDESQFRHVLSYVAGVTPLARASALATIESWFVEAEQEAGWDNPRAALAARLAELEKEIETAVEAEDYERADELNTAADGLRAELDAL